jgi:hypothetical protein
MTQLNLAQRAARCVERANAGDPVVLMIGDDQRDEAARLVGNAPVVIANREQTRRFLIFYAKQLRKELHG